jgi:serine phosphatase RsbU (regulator of sigma subunit)
MSNTARIGWIVAAAAAIFVVWLALASGGQVGIAFLYAVPIALASWWFGIRWGLLAALGCLCLYLLGAAIEPVSHFGIALGLRALVFLAVAVLAALLARRVAALEHSAEELEAIRSALAPPTLPEIAGVDVAAAFVPSELGVSGDFYLLTNGPDGSTVALVGDVVGHGPKAARLATFVRSRLAAFASNTSDPAEILTLANRAVMERPGGEREMLSAACLRFSPDRSTLAWAIAGHPLPLRLPDFQELDPGGTTLLLGADEDLSLTTSEMALGEDAGVLVYTDGATEVRGRGGARLGIEGFQALLEPFAAMPPNALVAEAEKAILAWAAGSIRDDLCILALRPEPR